MMKKSLCILLSLVLLLGLLPCSALGTPAIDLNRSCSLTIRYVHETRSETIELSGAEFQVYKVAAVNATCTKFELTGAFQPYETKITNLDNLTDLTTDGWQQLAYDLKSVVTGDSSIRAVKSGETDRHGELELTGMAPGLYLVVGEKVTLEDDDGDEYTYTAIPSLILLPNRDDETDTWVYDVTMEPKHEREKVEEETIELKVTKKWEGETANAQRPGSITVTLYRNGKKYDQVSLSAANSWTYTWEEVDAQSDWTIVEGSTNGYSSSCTAYGNIFVLTNTFYRMNMKRPDNDPSDDSSETTGDESESSGTVSDSSETTFDDLPDTADTAQELEALELVDIEGGDTPLGQLISNTAEDLMSLLPEDIPLGQFTSDDTQSNEKLPQTGVLWWPVPLLAALGLVCILLGMSLQRRKRHGTAG